MSVYQYEDYRHFLKEWINQKPKNGYGLMSRIAKYLSISSVSVSHIFSGDRNFSEEQAIELAEFLGLTESESDYFLLLVQRARAGSKKLEQKYDRQLGKLRLQAQDLKNRVPAHREMNESAKAQFYSNWYYSAVRLLTSLDDCRDIESISEHLHMSRSRVSEVLDFLTTHGLCIEKNGLYGMGPSRTHIDAKSPLVAAHHRNWRLKATEHFENARDDELFFTGPMTLSEDSLLEIRQELTNLLARITKMIEPSKSEVLACVNFDLFRV